MLSLHALRHKICVGIFNIYRKQALQVFFNRKHGKFYLKQTLKLIFFVHFRLFNRMKTRAYLERKMNLIIIVIIGLRKYVSCW